MTIKRFRKIIKNIDEPLMRLLELILLHKFGYSNVFDVVMFFCYHGPRQLFAVSGGDNKIENPSNGPAAMAIVCCDTPDEMPITGKQDFHDTQRFLYFVKRKGGRGTTSPKNLMEVG